MEGPAGVPIGGGHEARTGSQLYGQLAEAGMDELIQGSRVIVIGRTETDAWPYTQLGEKRTTIRVIVDRHGTIGQAVRKTAARASRSPPTRTPRRMMGAVTDGVAVGGGDRTRDDVDRHGRRRASRPGFRRSVAR